MVVSHSVGPCLNGVPNHGFKRPIYPALLRYQPCRATEAETALQGIVAIGSQEILVGAAYRGHTVLA